MKATSFCGVSLDGELVPAKVIGGYTVVDGVGSGTHTFRTSPSSGN